MHSTSFFVCFSLLTSLISGVAALSALYRCDSRDPATIKAAGGFKALGRDTPSWHRLYAHVDGTDTETDPFIFTTTTMDCGQHGQYRYAIDSSKIPTKIWDVNAEFMKAGKENDFADEMEQSVEFEVPWAAVVSVEKKRNGFGLFEPMNMPARRAPFAYDVRARLERV